MFFNLLFAVTCLIIKITYTEMADSDHENTVSENEKQKLVLDNEKQKLAHKYYNIPKQESTTEQYARDTTTFNWALGIVPYYIDSATYDSIIQRRVRMAMNIIERTSCVVFRALPDKPNGGNGSWLHFTNPIQRRDCVHDPIFGTNDEIVIILGFECMRRRDVLHALLHALGFKDEVSHPQRDQYIRVLWENIQPQYQMLFRIQHIDVPQKTLVEYDPMSIMHFHDRAFSRNGGATIAPLVPGLIINPSENLSQLDKMKLNLQFGHECNKRKVGSLLDTCKSVLHDDAYGNNNEGDNSANETNVPGQDDDKESTAEESDGDNNIVEHVENSSEEADNASEERTEKQ